MRDNHLIRKWFRLAFGLALASVLLMGGWLALQAFAAPEKPPVPVPFGAAMPGKAVIGFDPGMEESHLRGLLARHGASLADWIPNLGLALVDVPLDEAERAQRALRAQPEFDFVTDHRKVVQAADAPLDEHYGQQWGMDKVAGPAAWDLAWGDPSVVIAIVDTGVTYNHWDLRDQLWHNPGESAINPLTGQRDCADPISWNGVDDDGNGKIDDCRGWNFIAPGDKDPADATGHGTAVAGIALASTNNLLYGRYEGVAGLARQSQMMVLKALDSSGGWPFDIAAAIDYATASGADVINLSLALPPNYAYPEYLAMIRRAVERAQAEDILVVSATGNQNYPEVSYPAAFDGVLAVGASTQADLRASFSNYGAQMDLVAPGTGVYSTAGGPGVGTHDYGLYGGTGSGTSFATPHVSGVAALVRALRPDLDQSAVRDLILAGVDDVDQPGWDKYTGWGRLNAFRTLRAATADLSLGLAAEPASVARGGQATVRLQIFVPDSPATPAGLGARVALSASHGTITPTLITADGAGRAVAVFSADQVAGTTLITATLGQVTATVPITITSGLPVQMTLVASPNRIASGGGRSVVTATVRDEGGSYALDGTEVVFTVTLGALNPVTATTASGVAGTVLTSGFISGAAQLLARAGDITETVDVEIVGAGQPYSITLAAEPGAILVAGEPATVTATVFDGIGEWAVDGTLVHFESDLGAWSEPQVTTLNGVAITHLAAGTQPGQAHLLARAGAAEGADMVLIQPGLAHTVTVTADPVELVAGYNQLSTIRVVASDLCGNPVIDGSALRFAASLGQVSPAVAGTVSGVGAVQLVGELVAGLSQITVTAPGGVTGQTQVRIRPALPDTLLLDIDPTDIAVGGEAARLTATVSDPFGNPVADGTVITFTTDLGALRLGGGQAILTELEVGTLSGLAALDLVSGETVGAAHVAASVGPALTTHAAVVIRPGPPARLTLEIEPAFVRTGGRVHVVAAIEDSFGNHVADGVFVTFAADGDVLFDDTELLTAGGLAATWLTAGVTPGPVQIVAVSGGRSAFGALTVAADAAYLPLLLR